MAKKDIEGAPFVIKTFQLLSDSAHRDLVSWSETKDSFVVWNPVDFAAEILPKYFKHNNFCSFIRQLNTYGFHKVESKQWEFKHEYFQEGRSDMLKNINRRRSKKRDERDFEEDLPAAPSKRLVPAPPQSRDEPEDKDEVDKLKDLNTLLMKEVVRLQHQQETTNDTIKQILAELISSRQEQREITKKVTEIADFKEPYPSSKPQTPLSSPLSYSTPTTIPSSPLSVGSISQSPRGYNQQISVSPQTPHMLNNGYSYVKPEAIPRQTQPLINAYPTYSEIVAQQPQQSLFQPPISQQYSAYNQPRQVHQQYYQPPPQHEDTLDSFLNNDENFFSLDPSINGEFQTIQNLPNEFLNVNLNADPYGII